MRFLKHFLVLSLFFVLSGLSIHAQETQTKVVDEVVAQVNDDVITLSRIKREMKDAVDSLIQQGKSRADAEKLVQEKQGELIANLINEELLIQKAKESNLSSEIEASVNQRFLEIMKENKLKTVEALYAEMEKQGVNPQELRENWRKQATREQVIQREVQSKIYWKANGKELKDYFEKNKVKFSKPETISFSELFMAFAGRDEAAVRAKAKLVLAQLRGGADFAKTAQESGDKGIITDGTGKIENVVTKDLNTIISKPLTGVKVGGYTELIEIDQLGIAILRVDARSAASDDSVFNENAVRMAIMNDQFPAEQKKFLAKLRDDSYIKISDPYRPMVAPILFEDERKGKTVN